MRYASTSMMLCGRGFSQWQGAIFSHESMRGGDDQFMSKLTGEKHTVSYDKLVDVTFMIIAVPSTHTPNSTIAEDVHVMPISNLTSVCEKPIGYVIVGGGKSSMRKMVVPVLSKICLSALKNAVIWYD
jgi:hypothetical protein